MSADVVIWAHSLGVAVTYKYVELERNRGNPPTGQAVSLAWNAGVAFPVRGLDEEVLQVYLQHIMLLVKHCMVSHQQLL